MADRVLVEVQGENGAYYKAFVTDVLEDEIQLAFEKSWQPESKFPFARVRLPPNSAAQHQFEQEQEVEVSQNDLHFSVQSITTKVNGRVKFLFVRSTPGPVTRSLVVGGGLLSR